MKFKCVRISCESCPHKMVCEDSPYYGVEIPDDYIFVYWRNKYHNGVEAINAPITINEKCVGVITEVSRDYLYGKVFAGVLSARTQDGKSVSFEIVGGNNDGNLY